MMSQQLEAQLNSAVERIKYCTYYIDTSIDHVEPEGKSKQGKLIDASTVPANWPAQGKITGRDIELRYRDGPLVLKGLSFDVQGGEKVGVAGRTGSGKSILMAGLFRIQELNAGSITIDDIDISILMR
jgi:ATP-binding cassette subfamily C (CFTR/MRP) protein 1